MSGTNAVVTTVRRLALEKESFLVAGTMPASARLGSLDIADPSLLSPTVAFVAKYDNTGALLWKSQADGFMGDTSVSFDIVTAMAVDESTKTVIAAYQVPEDLAHAGTWRPPSGCSAFTKTAASGVRQVALLTLDLSSGACLSADLYTRNGLSGNGQQV